MTTSHISRPTELRCQSCHRKLGEIAGKYRLAVKMPALQAVQPFQQPEIPLLFDVIHSMPFAERRERLYLKGHYGCSISISTQTNLPQSPAAVCGAKAQFLKALYSHAATKHPR